MKWNFFTKDPRVEKVKKEKLVDKLLFFASGLYYDNTRRIGIWKKSLSEKEISDMKDLKAEDFNKNYLPADYYGKNIQK